MPRAPPVIAQGQIAKQLAPQGTRTAKKVMVLVGGAAAARAYYCDASHRQPDVKETCPLCIEELDETDKNFYPCPCGYQVCLFCYGRVQDLCNNMCPGCRREYGAPLDAPVTRPGSELPTEAYGAHGYGSGGATDGRTQPSPSHGNLTNAPRSTAVANAAAAAALGSRPQPRRAGRTQDPAAVALPTGSTWANSLAVPQHQLAEQMEPPRPPSSNGHAGVDESAWPTLGAATTAAPTPVPPQRQQQQQHQQQQQQQQQSLRRHDGSDSSGSTSADGPPIQLSGSSQDLHQDQQHHLRSHAAAAAAAAAAVAAAVPLQAQPRGTTAGQASVGTARHVGSNGQLAGAGAAPVPLNSKEAAARLVAMLRQPRDPSALADAAAGGATRAAGAKAPPPGFGAPAALAPPPGFGSYFPAPSTAAVLPLLTPPLRPPPAGMMVSGASASFVNQQDPSVPGPPMGRYLPIQPPPGILHPTIQQPRIIGAANGHEPQPGLAVGYNRAAPPGFPGHESFVSATPEWQQQQQQQSSILGGDSLGRSYSMWSGLPGIDLGPPLWQGPGGPLDRNIGEQQRGVGRSGYQDLSSAQAGGGYPDAVQVAPTIRAPPPGFGPSLTVGQGGGGASPAHRPYQPLGSANGSPLAGAVHAYNPLQAQMMPVAAARAPPPGMAAYRPQLGAGL